MSSSLVNAASDITPPMIGLGDWAVKCFDAAAQVVQIPRTLQGLFVEVKAEGAVEYGFQIVQGATPPAALSAGGVSTFAAPTRRGSPLATGEARQFKLPRASDEQQTVWLVWRSDDVDAKLHLHVAQGAADA